MKFGFIAKHRNVWPVAWLCEALGVSRSGFHAWLHRGRCARSLADEAMMSTVRASFVASARTYGARRVWRDVLAEGFACGLHRIEHLMRTNALPARPRRRALPRDDGLRMTTVAPNVNRKFTRTSRTASGSPTSRILDGRGMALCRRRHRFVLASGRGLVDEGRNERATRHRCPDDGDLATRMENLAAQTPPAGQIEQGGPRRRDTKLRFMIQLK
jgi:hypothetical protein